MSTARKKTYLALIAVGFVAMVVDRLVPRDETPIEVASGPVEDRGSAVLASDMPGERRDGWLPVPELPFPRLPAADVNAPSTRDPFEKPGVVPPDNTSEETPSDVNATSNTFGTLHRLDGVWLQGSLKIAIVNGAWVHIGQAVDGCVLKEVDGIEASFSCQDGEVKLRVGATIGLGHR